ncbi:MAG: DUF4388 domain-containing protein [Deltaproteobacteria bacterium]|nr:DUF4388 domain-containing protein [Deltaproteobacteria bacterium]
MRLKLVAGKDGEVALPAPELAGAGLRGAEVEWSALPGLGLLAPAGAAGAWFAGSLAAASFAEVAQLVCGSLKTGVLHLSLADGAVRHRKAIQIRDGQVVFASSSDPRDRLGPVLVRTGMVDEAVVERCGKLVAAGRPLGQVLVEEKILSAGQLYEAIGAQVREIFLSAFEAPGGEFLFREEPLDERSAVRLAERSRDLILAGLKRADAAERARGVTPLPGPEHSPALPAVPSMAAPPASPQPAWPEPPRASAPAQAAAPEAKRTSSSDIRPGGPFEAYKKLFRAVFTAAARASSEAGRQLDSWFDRVPPSRRALFDGVTFGPQGEVDVARVLENARASGLSGAAARARALEALEALLTFALFEARNRLSRDEAEALRREVGRIQMGG